MARVFTVYEAAEYLRVSPYTIRKWLRKGKIPGRKIGRAYHIVEAELEDMLRSSSLQSAEDDLHISEDEPTWRKRDEGPRHYREWCALSADEKEARAESAMGSFAHVPVSSEDVVRERKAEVAIERQRLKRLSTKA